MIIYKAFKLPLLFDMIKPLLMLLLPDLLVIGGEVAVESVVVGQEVRGRGVRVVQ